MTTKTKLAPSPVSTRVPLVGGVTSLGAVVLGTTS